jgi:hypothetical protein
MRLDPGRGDTGSDGAAAALGLAALKPRLLRFGWAWALGAAVAVCQLPAAAEPIVASAGLLTRVVFTDNLFLTTQGKESAAILQLLPNITSGRTGTRGSYRFFYGPSALIYGGGYSDLNRVFHVLQANANVDLVEDYVSLQIAANANQNLIDAGAPNTGAPQSAGPGNVGFTALGNPDAFAQTASISVAPVFQFPLLRADFGTVRFAPGVNYVFATQTADGRANTGNTGAQSSLVVTSGAYFSRLQWQVTGTSNTFNLGSSVQGTATDQGTGTSSLYLTLIYPVSPQWSLQGLAGYDWGNYDSLSNPGGARWRITPYWSPSANTSVGLGYGWRYFGNDYYANIQHKYKKTVLTASYETVVSNARTALLDASPVSFQDAFGASITNPTMNQTLSGSVANPALVSGVFVQHQLLASVVHDFGRNTAALYLTRNRWDYQDSANQIDDTLGNLVFTRRLSRLTDGSLGMQYWGYGQSALGAVDFTQYQIWTELKYRISRQLTGSTRYYHNQRGSVEPSQNYDENGLWLTLDWNL